MHVIVLGAGVIGVTTAYYLAERGYDVTVLERASDVASATSFANACQLSYSFTDALANPAFLRQLPGLLSGKDHGSHIRLSPALARWGLHFLRQCTTRRARDNTLGLLALALRSQSLLEEIRKELSFDFGYRPAGKLVLLGTNETFAAALPATELKRAHGSDATVVDRQATIEIEPALAHISKDFVGAIYSAGDELGDARLFSRGLQQHLEQSGRVQFEFGANIQGLRMRGQRVSGVDTTTAYEADAVVVCLGAWSEAILKPLRIDPHIYPVRGYSVTLPLGAHPPSVSVSSIRERIVFSRIHDTMRIAGFADFAGFNTGNDTHRINTLLEVARNVAPYAADYAAEDTHSWGGFRPITPSGLPLVGKTRFDGLYLNAGHGMLGWTLACVSAHDAAEAVAAGKS
ncbi:MAG TPA: FAD-dependent oxidoreductase [Woeseiaceae bacterium]|nr:FAD-dependent oxidoreductase [Woeseiaceae bacterium]